jgi:aminopeptidase N
LEEKRDGFAPMRLYYRKAVAQDMDPQFAREIFEAAREGMTYFTNFFGTPYPYSKYDQVFLPEFASVAMENVGCVTWTEEALNLGEVNTIEMKMDFQTTNLHELAH